MNFDSTRGLSRRDFVASAVAIGGTSALGACQEVEQSAVSVDETATGTDDGATYPRGVEDPAELPDRQHAWDEYLVHGAHGTTIQGQHQLMLGLTYDGTVPPTDDERATVEAALQTLERAFQWGSGLDKSGEVNNGLLFMLAYSPRYLDAVGIESEGVQSAEAILEALDEDPAKADGFDALLLLDSDYGSILLSVEEAMFGERETVNGVDVGARLGEVFSVDARRSGVLGKGVPADELDNESIPEDAALSMGFRAGFDNSLPSEDSVTRTDGPFAGGTTLVTSRLETRLDDWYDQPHEDRRKEMYCPAHTDEEVGETGERLGNHSLVTPENVENMDELAAEHGIVGHAQKVASARDEEFVPRILRRSEGIATDEVGGSVFNFSSIQRDTSAFLDVRRAMRVEEYDHDVPEEKHGIVHYLETKARGTFLVPPRSRRSLPVPR